MSLLLYAIAECRDPGSITGVGLGGQALSAVAEGGLTAVVSEHAGRPAAAVEALWTYELAIEPLMDHYPVLPARFGTLFESEQAVRAMLRERHDQWARALEGVRGAVELGVRASWPVAPANGSYSSRPNRGTAYMLERLELSRRASALAARIDEPLSKLARARACKVQAHPAVPVTAAYLVDRERMNDFLARVRELDGAIEDAQLVCTGPWPPYSFAQGRQP
jgi:hypothetical protein